jgi:hypothetical protein
MEHRLLASEHTDDDILQEKRFEDQMWYIIRIIHRGGERELVYNGKL